ncbi:MAG: hypothetical protein AB7V77_04125 [Candidatus Woesearchaeota archaeon]
METTKQVYANIKPILSAKIITCLSVAKLYHERKAFYRSREGEEEIKTRLEEFDDIYTLSKGRQKLKGEVFEELQNEFNSSLDFLIINLTNKNQNYLNEHQNSKENKTKYGLIISYLNDLRNYSKKHSWDQKNTINQIYDKYREINEKLSYKSLKRKRK